MDNKIKPISVKDFRGLGYLQELNRRFLHPLGLALSVSVDDSTGEESFGPILDYRDDPEGILYGEKLERSLSVENAIRINEEIQDKFEHRQLLHGFCIQPIKTVIDVHPY
jgi:hypothetical protein